MNKLLIIALLISGSSYAQTNFNGSWKINKTDYISGPKYGNAVANEISFSQKKDSLVIENATGETKGRTAYALNGKASTKTTSRKYVFSMNWSADKTQLITTSVFYIPENANQVDFTRVDTYNIENGQLILNRKSEETRSETWEVKATYEKQ